MKTIKFIALIALMMMGKVTLKAQEYHPLAEDGKQWNVLFSYPWSPPEPQHKYTDIYKIEGDTLVDGVSYKMMYTTRNENLTGWNLWGFIRETEDGQVLSRQDASSYEQILYDFSLEVGDTIIMNGNGFYPDRMFVVETNEILIGGEPRKQIVLEYPWGDQEVWIEGIGSLYGIVDSGSLFLTGGSTDLLCCYEDGDLIWQNTTPGYDECYIVNTGQQGSFVVAPSTLTFEEPFVPQTFTIYNQTDNAVTISAINVQPDDNMVLLSGPGLPRTLQPNENMNVEVYVNGVGYKGYLTYYVNVATSIGNRQVTVRVNEEAWDEGLLWMPMQGLTFDENSPLTQGFNLTNTNALDSITIYELYEDGTNYLELVPSHSLPYVIPPHESLYIDVTLVNFPENTTNVNIYSSSSLGQGSSPYVHVVGGLTPYYPLVHEGNDRQKWNVVYIASMNYPNDYFTEIQSIRDNINLDGVDYKLVWTEDVYDSKRIAGAVREEDKRVYFRRYWQQSYQDEVLLYDFNLTVGDTVTVNYFEKLIVLEESQVLVQGIMRKQLGLAMYFDNGTTGEIEEYWIEGVGSTYGFLNSGYEGWDGAFVYLLCYHENGNLIWDNEEFDDCVMNSNGAPATFAPQGAEWYFDVFNPWGTHPEYQRFFVEGDTIIQGHQCSIIDQHFLDTGHDGGEFVYEEDNKVYWFNPTTNAFSTLYDFDAEAGESWDYEVGECSHQVVVDSVGSATWNGHTYRTQWVCYYEDPWVGSSGKGKIIEGVGYEKGLFPSIEVCNGWEVFDASEIEYLRCYVDDGEMLYHEGGYDCEQTTVTPPSHPEWYYEILNENGTITYQYMYQAGDTIINDEPTHILVKINTLYDKGLREEVTHEYVFELNGKLYWWNKRLGLFTVLYDYEAKVGDSWNIFVGTEILTMHVDAVEEIEYEGRTYRMLRVSDPEDLFSGNIVCGIGHLTSFFPERLMDKGDGLRVEGMRCYWNEGELVFKYGDEDCDAVISELHGIEEDGPSTGSEALTVYPNPTNDVLFVETNGRASLSDQVYRISNLMGQNLMTGSITAETMQIDVSNLPQGMYFITVGGETQKFVVR